MRGWWWGLSVRPALRARGAPCCSQRCSRPLRTPSRPGCCDLRSKTPQGSSPSGRVEKGDPRRGRPSSWLHPAVPVGAAGPDDSGDDLPMVPEDNVEMAPAADEHIEAQRVGQAGRGGGPHSSWLLPQSPAARGSLLPDALCLPGCAPSQGLRAAGASPCPGPPGTHQGEGLEMSRGGSSAAWVLREAPGCPCPPHPALCRAGAGGSLRLRCPRPG